MYAPTALYFYKALFAVELCVAEYIICIGMKRRSHYALRLFVAVVLCLGASFALPVAAYNAIYSSFMFIILFGVSMLGMWFCYAENGVSLLFRAIASYTIQHVAYQIFDLMSLGISALFSENAGMTGAYGSSDISMTIPAIFNAVRSPDAHIESGVAGMFSFLFMIVAYLFIYTLTYYAGGLLMHGKLKDSDKFELKSSTLFIFIMCFVLFNIVVSAFVTYYSGDEFDVFYVALLDFYNICNALFTLYLMIGIVYRKQLERNFSVADRLLKQSVERYELAKRNVELINMKCHDMKHQIHSVAGRVDPNVLKEVEDIISVYDANIRTGNDALDIILTEKSLYCQKHNIKLYCIVDGKLLKFMADADLYSLFGNILDNAIDAVRPLGKNKRFINLAVRANNGFVCITESNSCDKTLEFDDGLPKSTKSDKDLHGFGMKSIRYICKKYNAELAIASPQGKFELNILFL